jgi:PIN domain-containing protein
VDTLVFYFDRTFGIRLPKAMDSMRPPFLVKWHQEQGFAHDTPDDVWLNKVGPAKWVVFTQDRKYHTVEAELLAIKQHGIRCFYMPMAGENRWTSLCHFAWRWEKMHEIAQTKPPPFIYEMKANRQFYQVKLP